MGFFKVLWKFYLKFLTLTQYLFKDASEDALSIYSKYISKDGKYSIEAPNMIIVETICNFNDLMC